MFVPLVPRTPVRPRMGVPPGLEAGPLPDLPPSIEPAVPAGAARALPVSELYPIDTTGDLVLPDDGAAAEESAPGGPGAAPPALVALGVVGGAVLLFTLL